VIHLLHRLEKSSSVGKRRARNANSDIAGLLTNAVKHSFTVPEGAAQNDENEEAEPQGRNWRGSLLFEEHKRRGGIRRKGRDSPSSS